MECLPTNVILEFNPNTLENVRKIHGFENPEVVTKIVDTLEEWVKHQKHILKKDFSRQYLENMIIASKGSLKRAQKRLDRVCMLRTQHPQFFGNFDIRNDFQEFDGIMTYAILPKLTKDYNRIWLIKNSGRKFNSNLILQFSRICVMVFEYLKAHDYSDGVICVVDLTEASLLEIIRRINLQDLRQAATILIEGYGVRVKGLHVISASRIVNALVWIFKQVLSAKLVKEWLSVLGSEDFRSYLSEMTEACVDESLIEKT
ncbi:CRAL/TRIO domain-containing protein [Phthorimaea operculella]|nr:CRAL/TRIO domain-containing protein [Phthorimaea operculella]